MFREEKQMETRLNLSDLKKGERAEIMSTEAKGDIRKRLLDMGLVKGQKLLVIRKAPLGDPLEIKLNGFYLSLRLDEAKYIFVKTLD